MFRDDEFVFAVKLVRDTAEIARALKTKLDTRMRCKKKKKLQQQKEHMRNNG